MPSKLQIWNMALGEIPDAPVQAEDERSLQARECARYYPQCVAELLEAHEWSFANKRVALAGIDNDRPNEWAYAYALPIDLGSPRRIIVPGWEPLGWGCLADWAEMFLTEGGTLYANAEVATLEYGAVTISETMMPPKFVRALYTDLASRLAMPLQKNRELRGDLIKLYEVEKERAIADDLNRQPRNVPDVVPAAGIARHAGDWTDRDYRRAGYAPDPLTDDNGAVLFDG